MKQTAQRALLRGIAELCGGVLCLLSLLVTLFFMRPSFGALSLFLLGFMLLTADGLVSILRSEKPHQFK